MFSSIELEYLLFHSIQSDMRLYIYRFLFIGLYLEFMLWEDRKSRKKCSIVIFFVLAYLQKKIKSICIYIILMFDNYYNHKACRVPPVCNLSTSLQQHWCIVLENSHSMNFPSLLANAIANAPRNHSVSPLVCTFRICAATRAARFPDWDAVECRHRTIPKNETKYTDYELIMAPDRRSMS